MSHFETLQSLVSIADQNPINTHQAPELPARAHKAGSSAVDDLLVNIDRLTDLQGRLSHMLTDLEELVGLK